jgi:hypothetical protein
LNVDDRDDAVGSRCEAFGMDDAPEDRIAANDPAPIAKTSVAVMRRLRTSRSFNAPETRHCFRTEFYGVGNESGTSPGVASVLVIFDKP